MGSSSPARDWTQAPCTRCEESATGPPGKSQDGKFDVMFFLTTIKNLWKLKKIKKNKKEKEHNQIYHKEENKLQLLWLFNPHFFPLSKLSGEWKLLSHVRLFVTPWTPWNSPGQNTGEGSLSLLQGIFPTQGAKPGLLHCRWILYPLSYQGSLIVIHKYSFSLCGQKREGEEKYIGICRNRDLPLSLENISFWSTGQ